jgi:hypothetical protein
MFKWFIQNILIFHFSILATYFQAWAFLIAGDRVANIYVESASFMTVKKERMEEHMFDSDEEADEIVPDGDNES